MTAIACTVVFTPQIVVAEEATPDASPVDSEC
jgi:hypothetical protein